MEFLNNLLSISFFTKIFIHHKGRAIPFYFTTYSSKTIKDKASSRNLEHLKTLEEIKELVGDKPLVFDREFIYESFLRALTELGMKFVIRLNTGNNVRITDQNNNRIVLKLAKGETKVWESVYYKGEIKVDIIWYFGMGHYEPLHVMTNIEPKEALRIYLQRMKIDKSFRDNKRLLGIEKIMSKKEKIIGCPNSCPEFQITFASKVFRKLSMQQKRCFFKQFYE